jgi:DNA replication protein DnaC
VNQVTAAAIVSDLIGARDEKKLSPLQKQMASYELLIVVELISCRCPGPRQNCCLKSSASTTRHFHARHIQSAASGMTEILGSERMTGSLLDRLTHHIHIPRRQIAGKVQSPLLVGPLNTGRG